MTLAYVYQDEKFIGSLHIDRHLVKASNTVVFSVPEDEKPLSYYISSCNDDGIRTFDYKKIELKRRRLCYHQDTYDLVHGSVEDFKKVARY